MQPDKDPTVDTTPPIHRPTEGTQEPKEFWGIVEVMGHQRFAGKVSEFQFAGAAFVRVDIPEVKRIATQYKDGEPVKLEITLPAYTKTFGSAAIYGMTPTTEDVARKVAAQSTVDPLFDADVRKVALKMVQSALPSDAPSEHDDQADTDDNWRDDPI